MLLGLTLINAGSDTGEFLFNGLVTVHLASLLPLFRSTLASSPLGLRIVMGMMLFLSLRYVLYETVRHGAGQFAIPVTVPELKASESVKEGDLLVLSGEALAHRLPKRGEIVAYHLTSGSAGYVNVRGGWVIDRVVGLPGDTVELKGGVITCNGEELSKTERPLGRVSGFPTFVTLVPEDAVIIVPSLHNFSEQQLLSSSALRQLSTAKIAQVHRIAWRLRPLHRMGTLEERHE